MIILQANNASIINDVQNLLKNHSNFLGNKIFIICGPTASGKSQIAMDLARSHPILHSNCTIINADSMQIYKECPILTAQPNESHKLIVNHQLYGFKSISNYITNNDTKRFSIKEWMNLAVIKIDEARLNKSTPILVGGSGMYINGLIFGIAKIPEIDKSHEQTLLKHIAAHGTSSLYHALQKHDPEYASKISSNDKQRITRALSVYFTSGKKLSELHKQHHSGSPYNTDEFIIIYMNEDRKELYQNINERVLTMLTNGAIDEVNALKQRIATQSKIIHIPPIIGLNTIGKYIDGNINKDTMVETIQQETRRYAKRQVTYFNGLINKLSKTENPNYS